MNAIQHKLKQRLSKRFEQFTNENNKVEAARAKADIIRFDALETENALEILNAIPSTQRFTVPDEQFTIVLRRILGTDLITPTPHSIELICTCGEEITNPHLQSCNRNYEAAHHHNNVRDLIAACIRAAKLPTVIEPGLGVGQLRWDIKTHSPHDHNSPFFIDITVTAPQQKKYINSKAIPHHDKILQDAYKHKISKYSEPLKAQPHGSTFTPFVFTNYGSSHQDVRNFLKGLDVMAKHIPPFPHTFTSHTFYKYWMQAISVAIHSGTAISIIQTIRSAQLQALQHT